MRRILLKWHAMRDSNPQPTDSKSATLSIELMAHVQLMEPHLTLILYHIPSIFINILFDYIQFVPVYYLFLYPADERYIIKNKSTRSADALLSYYQLIS